MRDALPPQRQFHGQHLSHLPADLGSTGFVYVRHGPTTQGPLGRPYTGPFRVISKNDKFFTVNHDGREENVTVNRLKTAHKLPEAESDPTRASLPLAPPCPAQTPTPARPPPPPEPLPLGDWPYFRIQGQHSETQYLPFPVAAVIFVLNVVSQLMLPDYFFCRVMHVRQY